VSLSFLGRFGVMFSTAMIGVVECGDVVVVELVGIRGKGNYPWNWWRFL
jgi:hypothetical protein